MHEDAAAVRLEIKTILEGLKKTGKKRMRMAATEHVKERETRES